MFFIETVTIISSIFYFQSSTEEFLFHFCYNRWSTNHISGTGEIVQHLRALDALLEDQGFFPQNSHERSLVIPVPVDRIPSSSLGTSSKGTAYMWHTGTHAAIHIK